MQPAQPANPVIDDLARNNIALQRLSLIHLKCIQWAQEAGAAEQNEGQKEEADPNALAGGGSASSEEQTSYGNPSTRTV